MTLDEAIAHAREVATEQKRRSGECVINDNECDKFSICIKCAKEHEQLAEWLEELKKNKDTSAEVYESGYRRGFREGYNKAIDNLVGSLKDYFVIPHDVRVIEMKANELKAGE